MASRLRFGLGDVAAEARDSRGVAKEEIMKKIIATSAVVASVGLSFGTAACGSTAGKPVANTAPAAAPTPSATQSQPTPTQSPPDQPPPAVNATGTVNSCVLGEGTGAPDAPVFDTPGITFGNLPSGMLPYISLDVNGTLDSGSNPPLVIPITVTFTNASGTTILTGTNVAISPPTFWDESGVYTVNIALPSSAAIGATACTATSNGGPSSSPTPGSSGGSGDQYAQDIQNAGIVAPVAWIDKTGQTLCADWAAGDTESWTDQNVLLAGGIHPNHLATYDSITNSDVCPGQIVSP